MKKFSKRNMILCSLMVGGMMMGNNLVVNAAPTDTAVTTADHNADGSDGIVNYLRAVEKVANHADAVAEHNTMLLKMVNNVANREAGKNALSLNDVAKIANSAKAIAEHNDLMINVVGKENTKTLFETTAQQRTDIDANTAAIATNNETTNLKISNLKFDLNNLQSENLAQTNELIKNYYSIDKNTQDIAAVNNSVVAIDNAVNDLYNTVEKENGLQSAAIRANSNRITNLDKATTEMGAAVTTLAKAVDSENARQDADITNLNNELARIDLKTKYTVDDVNALSVKEAKLADKTEAINKSVANLTKTVTDNKTAQDTAVAELNGKFATVDEYAKNVASALTDLEETVKQENDNQNKRVMDLRSDHEDLEDTVSEIGSIVTTLAKAVDTENTRQDAAINNNISAIATLNNTTTEIKETLADEISDVKFDLKALRVNKADANEVNEKITVLNEAVAANDKSRRINEKLLNKAVNSKVAMDLYNENLATQAAKDDEQSEAIAINDKHIAEHDSKINNHDSKIVELETRQNDAQKSRAENAKAIKALETKTDATNNRVNALEAGAEKLNGSVKEIMAVNATQAEAIAKLDKTQAADRATVKEDLAKVNSTISTTVATINADLKAVQSNVTTENARQDEAISQNMAAITSLKNATSANMSAALAPVNSKNAMQDTAIANNLKAINSLQDTTKAINATTAEIGAAVTAVATAVDSENARQDQAIENCNARLEDHKNAIAATAILAYKNKDAIKALSDEIVEAYGGTPETEEEADTSMLLPGHVFATVNGKVETVKKASKPGELMAAERAETANHFAKVDTTNARQDAQISSLRTDLERTGADSAALAALKPLPTDAKNQVMVGAGHYRGKTSFAMGLAYRPNEDFMAHVGTTLSDSHAMINTGVTFAIGSGKVAHRNDEIKALKERIEVLEQQIQELLAAK